MFCIQVFPIPLRGTIPDQFRKRIIRIWLSLQKYFIGLEGDHFTTYIKNEIAQFKDEDLKKEIEEMLVNTPKVFLKPEQCCGDYIWCHLFCSTGFQKKCEFGGSACNFIIEKIIKKNTIPPQYDISMNGSGGQVINLKAEDILQFNRFKKKVMECCNFVPVKPLHPPWDVILNYLHDYALSQVEIKEEEVEEYDIGVIYDVIRKWVARSKGDATTEAFDAGMPIKIGKVWYASGEAIVRELERRGVRFSREDLFHKLKDFYKCIKLDIEIEGQKRTAWKLIEVDEGEDQVEQTNIFTDDEVPF